MARAKKTSKKADTRLGVEYPKKRKTKSTHVKEEKQQKHCSECGQSVPYVNASDFKPAQEEINELRGMDSANRGKLLIERINHDLKKQKNKTWNMHMESDHQWWFSPENPRATWPKSLLVRLAKTAAPFAHIDKSTIRIYPKRLEFGKKRSGHK